MDIEELIESYYLPEPALGLIASYLCVIDLRQFRLVSTLFYEVSFFSEVLCNLKIVIQKVKQQDVPIFLNFLEKVQYGRFSPITVLQNNFTSDSIATMAENLHFVTDLSIDILHAEAVAKCCPYIKHLTLTSSLQNLDRQDDDVLLHQCQALEKLYKLEELVIQGNERFYDYSRFPARFVVRVNECLRTVKKVVFRRLFFVRDYTVYNDLLNIDFTRIRSWTFQYVYMIGGFLVHLPNDIDSLECFLAEDIRWPRTGSSLKSLNLDSSSLPREWSDKNYKKLEHITFTKIKFLSMYPPLCKHLYSLHLVDCVHATIYLKLLSSFTDSLRKLTLEAVCDSSSTSDMEYYRDNRIQEIVNEIIPGIEILELRNIQMISPDLFDGLNSISLRLIIINNCSKFENVTVKKDYSFNVKIKRKCSCMGKIAV